MRKRFTCEPNGILASFVRLTTLCRLFQRRRLAQLPRAPSQTVLARASCSARTVASSRWTSARMGASVPRAFRHRASWLAYRSSWRVESWLGSRSGMGGQPDSVVLLGDHVIEPGLQVAPRPRYRVPPVAVRDGVFQLAAVAAQLGRGQRIKGMFRLCDGCWVGGHGCWS